MRSVVSLAAVDMCPWAFLLAAVIAAASVVTAGAGQGKGTRVWTRGVNAVIEVDLASFNQSVTVGKSQCMQYLGAGVLLISVYCPPCVQPYQ